MVQIGALIVSAIIEGLDVPQYFQYDKIVAIVVQ
jgi:hypothetical protein